VKENKSHTLTYPFKELTPENDSQKLNDMTGW